MLFEVAIVIVLTLVNGLLAMSELAIVSARPARLRVLAAGGSHGAATALRLADDPGRFLSSVQIGITLVGVLSGAFSGATLGVRLADALLAAGLPAGAAQGLGVGGVVVAITYLSLILGELVPKQVALRAPESVAARVAPLMQGIALVAAPLVWLLDRSGKLVLALLGQSGAADRGMTDEEVRLVIEEAGSAGVIEAGETRMIAGVMRIADRNARGLMTPRHEVDSVDVSAPVTEVLQRFRATGHAYLPVHEGSGDVVIGLIALRDMIDRPAAATTRDLLTPATAVPDALPALDVIEALRASPARMVLVQDEYGHFEGVITPMDVMEGIAGEFSDPGTAEPKVVTRADGSLLVAGWMPADEFAERLGLMLEPGRDYATVAGLVLERLGELPQTGRVFDLDGWRVEVLDLDGRRIDKLLVNRDRE